MNNLVIEYSSSINRIEDIIERLKEMSFNTADYWEVLESIKSDVSTELKKYNSVGYSQKNAVDSIYQLGIEKANKLLNDLRKYSEYFEIKNKCSFIEGSQDFIEFSDEELDNVVDNIIELRNKSNEISGFMESFNNNIDNLYEAMYTIIKTEFSIRGKSRLFDYCKNNPAEAYIFKKLINEDIKKLKDNKYDISKINALAIKNSDLYDYQLDEDLVLLISLTRNKDVYTKELVNSLAKYLNDFINADSEIKDVLYNRNYSERQLNYITSDGSYRGSSKKKLVASNIIPCILALIPIVSTHAAICVGITGVGYETEVQTYSAQTGQTINSVEYIERLKDSAGNKIDNAVMVETTNPWESKSSEESNETYFERKIEKTVIKGVEYEDLDKYLDLDILSLGDNIEYSFDVERKYSLTASDMYKDSTDQVVRMHQNPTDSKLNEVPVGWTIVTHVIALCGDCVIFLLLCFIPSGKDKKVIDNIFDISNGLRHINYNNKQYNEQLQEVKKYNDKIRDLLENNKVIKEKYLSLKSNPKYKFFVNEFEDKMREIDNIISEIEEIKVLNLKK